jgi:hypothetical protein
MPDGISAQTSLRANLPQVAELKRKQLFDAMKNSAPQPAGSRIGIGSNGSLTGLKMPDADVTKPLVSPSPAINLPTPDTSGIQTTPERTRIGIDLSGLKGSDRGLAQLQAMQDANAQGLNTKTAGDFVETQPPRPKHLGLLTHLKNAGKDLVVNMGEYAKTHPGASTGELLGAGGAGALVGGISPDAGDVLNRKYQIEQQQGDVANQLGIEGRQAQVVNEQNKPLVDLARIKAENQRTQDQADREDARLRETARHNREAETERRNRPRAARQPLKQADDQGNEYYADPDTGEPLKDVQGNIRYASRTKPQSEDYAALRDWNFKKQGEAEQTAAGIQKQLDAMPAPSATDPNYYGIKDERDRLQKQLDDAKQNAQKYRDEGDKAAAKIKTGSAVGPTPDKPEPKSNPSRVSEQAIRDAAKAKGLDPEIAVQRARSRKMIP